MGTGDAYAHQARVATVWVVRRTIEFSGFGTSDLDEIHVDGTLGHGFLRKRGIVYVGTTMPPSRNDLKPI